MSPMNPKVDGYIRKNKKWGDELQKLRTIVLNSPLTEEVKWRVPCYTLEGKNIVFLGAFKESCVLSFVKGVLLKDAKGILTQPGEQTQGVRVVRFTSVREIAALERVLKAYILEAIDVENSGVKVPMIKITERPVPDELQKKLDELPALKAAFHALTAGRQRAYLMFIAGAKQSATREARVEKHIQRILDGKGLDD